MPKRSYRPRKGLQVHQKLYWDQRARTEEEHGPMSLRAKLSKRDLAAAKEAARVGAGLRNTYIRLTPEELKIVVTEAVNKALSQKSFGWRHKLIDYLTNAILGGIMSSATWDILKYFIPSLHTVFMSADQSDFMKRSTEAYLHLRDQAPAEFSDFSEKHYRGLQTFRFKTWRELGDQLYDSDLGKELDDDENILLLEILESHLFVPVRS